MIKLIACLNNLVSFLITLYKQTNFIFNTFVTKHKELQNIFNIYVNKTSFVKNKYSSHFNIEANYFFNFWGIILEVFFLTTYFLKFII